MAGTPVKTTLTALSIALLLAACNENDHDTPQPIKKTVTNIKTLTVTPSLGQFFNADVVLRNALTNQELGRQALTNGKVTFNVAADISSVIAEVQGDADAQYFDEATSSKQAFATGNSLRAAISLSNATTNASITSLTEAAVKYAETLAGGLSNTSNISAANQKIAQIFGVTNVTQPVILIGSPQDYLSLLNSTDTNAKNYALRLAALAQSARDNLNTTQQPALKMAKALAADLSDGALNAQQMGDAYQAEELANSLKTSLAAIVTAISTNAAQTGFSATQVNQLTSLINTLSNQITINHAITHQCDTGMKTLTIADLAAFVGTYNITIHQPSPNDQEVFKTTTLTLASDGKVTLDGQAANSVAVCENTMVATGEKIGVLVQLNKATAFGAAHIDFNNDKTVNGTDFTAVATASRFFNGQSDTVQSITITPSLGKILNAKVILRNARTGAELGQSNTGLIGRAEFKIPKNIDTVIVEVLGGGGAKYFDEAKGEQPLPEAAKIRAAAPIVDNSNVGVSILTEAAVKNAESLEGGLSKPENIVKANKDVGDAVGVSNITQAPALIGSTEDYQQLKNDAASQYALQLAALVKAAADHVSGNTPALDLLNKLADDLSDGVLDGKKGTNTLTDLPYANLASVFAAAWQLAMQDVLNTLTQQTIKEQLKANVVDQVDVKDVINGQIVTDNTDFGGSSEKPWKGEIYLLAKGTPYLPDFSTLTPIGTLYTSSIDISPRPFTEPFPGVPSNRFEWFGVRYQGPLTISVAGEYNFRTISDDGSKIFIDNVLVVNHDGQHAPSSSARATVNLSKGVHTLRVEYFQGPATYIALQVFGNKVGVAEKILTPVIPVSSVD